MSKEEILFFKHCLQDYNFYKKQVAILNDILSSIEKEKVALAFPKIYYDGSKNTRDIYKTMFDTVAYGQLVEQEEQIRFQIRLYSELISYTENLLDLLDEDVRTIVQDIYINKIPIRKVTEKYFYTDEKSLYRVIRNSLQKIYYTCSGESCH